MPLSKARNRDRMRESRLHKQLSPLSQSKPVQPKPSDITMSDDVPWYDRAGVPVEDSIAGHDADGYPIYSD